MPQGIPNETPLTDEQLAQRLRDIREINRQLATGEIGWEARVLAHNLVANGIGHLETACDYARQDSILEDFRGHTAPVPRSA